MKNAQAVLFDTLNYCSDLVDGGIDRLHAEAISKATSKVIKQTVTSELASREDVLQIRLEICKAKDDLTKYINSNAWRTISLLATFQTLVIGAFGVIQYLLHG